MAFRKAFPLRQRLPSVGELSAKQTERLSNSLLFLFQKLQKKLFMNARSLAARAGTRLFPQDGKDGLGQGAQHLEAAL